MGPTFTSPVDLVEGLHGRDPRARAQLWQLLREPVDQLMAAVVRRHDLPDERKYLTDHALHSAEAWLRSRPAGRLDAVGWGAFRAAVLTHLAKLATQPHGAADGDGRSHGALPDGAGYRSDTFSRPYSRLGARFFGGDWYAGRRLDDGSLWVFVADVTGHGYFAYLLACALPAVWARCWAAHPGTPPEPAELLAVMHELLSDCLPDGIFLEATLARLAADGRTTVVPAGGTRLVVRGGVGPPGVVKLRGAWLGLCAPRTEQQHTLHLAHGDELILATDGAVDQLHDQGGLDALATAWRGGSTFALLRRLLEESLSAGEQKDDITVVWLERRSDV